jgi:hypothetical protein
MNGDPTAGTFLGSDRRLSRRGRCHRHRTRRSRDQRRHVEAVLSPKPFAAEHVERCTEDSGGKREARADLTDVVLMYMPPQKEGHRLIWLEGRWVTKLDSIRGPAETYCDVILRLTKKESRGGASAVEGLRGAAGNALPNAG